MNRKELKDFLDEKALLYNNVDFIESDPIQIPHRYTKKEDIEISGFLVATISWGNRKSIINNGIRLIFQKKIQKSYQVLCIELLTR